MSSELERVLAFEDRLRGRAAERVVPFSRGRAYFSETFPRVWDLNGLLVEDPDGASAAELAEEAERLHGEAGHAHRRVLVADERVGAELEPSFAELGWRADRLLHMAYRGPGERRPDTSGVVEVDARALRPLREEFARAEPWADGEDVVGMVVDAWAHTSRLWGARHFAVLVDGEAASTADLYTDGATAQVEDVVTALAHRNRGHASAVVARAVEEAVRGGCDLVFLVAADDDWPKELYGSLGFEPIGRSWSFLKPPAPA
ncbi:MAG TPA: GNAT family N-acetyltransferase [Gaiellaceae bacterium]|nr:GNAT family N-acetyltransferase [Gaiellaceae bacterium]